MLQVLAIFLPGWLTRNLPIKRNQELNAASAYIKQVCRDLIAKKRTVLAEKGVEDVDILSVALGSGGFQDHELVNQMMTFLIAGHETTATAMVSSFFALPFLKQKKSKKKSKKKSASTYQLNPLPHRSGPSTSSANTNPSKPPSAPKSALESPPYPVPSRPPKSTPATTSKPFAPKSSASGRPSV